MDSKTRAELIFLCKERGIPGYSGKKKADILQLLTQKQTPILTIQKNVSPLRYPGGKTRAVSILYDFIQKYYPGKKQLLSPFFGGGSVELFLSVNGYTVLGNDLFVPLFTFWSAKQTDCEKLIAKIKQKMPISKEQFALLRQTIMTETDMYDMASSYFVINRSSFSGATLCGGFSAQSAKGRLTESSVERLRKCNTSAIHFSNLDCIAFLEKNPETTETLVYADPPYFIDKYIYGKNGDMHENFNHSEFAKNIQKRKDWIVSYNDCAHIRKLYAGCSIFEVKWSYGMNESKKSSEILILPPVS